MSTLQEKFDGSSGEFHLPPGRYEGPLVIGRPCAVTGNGAIIWADSGPVLTVNAEGVTLKSLRLETGENGVGDSRSAALLARRPGLTLSRVEVAGGVLGIVEEPEELGLPRVIPLGDFAADQENVYKLSLTLPADAVLASAASGVSVSPRQLRRGRNEVVLRVGAMHSNLLLYGELLIMTKVTRRIYLSGRPVEGAPPRRDDQLPVRPEFAFGSEPDPLPVSVLRPQLPAEQEGQVARRGERIPVTGGEETPFWILYDHRGTRQPLAVDAYVFLLGADGRVRNDQDLVFFGQRDGEEQAVQVGGYENAPDVRIDLQKIPPDVEHITVCYSIYGKDAGKNFGLIDSPLVRLCTQERELYRFALSNLRQEKTAVALELYRHQGQWKVRFIGEGFIGGLEALCGHYGLEVTDG